MFVPARFFFRTPSPCSPRCRLPTRHFRCPPPRSCPPLLAPPPLAFLVLSVKGFRAGRCTDGFLNLRAGRRGQREHERRADPPRMRASPAGCSPSSRSGHGREEIPPDTPPSAPLYPGLRRTRGSRGTPRDGPLVENVPRLRGSRESSPGPHMLRGAALSGAAMLSCGLRVGVTFASEGPGDAYKARSAQCLFLPHTSFMTRKNELVNNRAFRT